MYYALAPPSTTRMSVARVSNVCIFGSGFLALVLAPNNPSASLRGR